MRCEKLPKSEIVKLNRDENDLKDSKYKNRKKRKKNVGTMCSKIMNYPK